MINVVDLEFRYGEGGFHLKIPRLSIERGSTVAVIGPSGTGKTTLLNLIAGIVTPLAGRIVTNDTDVTTLGDSARRDFRIRQIGLVFQEFELLAYLNVLDNILLPYRINPSLPLRESVRRRAVELARSVGIEDKLNRQVDRLSQGERQRVAVCRALLPEPALLLADEPTGNLDPTNKGRVLDILFDYVAKNGTTLVTVTHDHDLLGRFGRVIEFRDVHSGGEGGSSIGAGRQTEHESK
jgi:putative ABC transport system ATP-binding protein